MDLDGTLLNSRGEVSEGNRRAMTSASARGVQFAVVTGRRIHSARPFVEKIPVPVVLITSNGAVIGTSAGDILHRNFLPRAVACRVVGATPDFRPYTVAIFDVPGRGQVTMQDCAVPEGPLGWYLRNAPQCLLRVPALEAAIATDPVQIMFGGPPERIEPAEVLLRRSPVAEFIQLTWTKYLERDVSILDVMNRGCSKGVALKLWAERCGIDSSEVMAIGDNFNDLEMLHFAGQPVLMANHSPGLDQNGWPRTLSNDQDGVAAAIDAYVLG